MNYQQILEKLNLDQLDDIRRFLNLCEDKFSGFRWDQDALENRKIIDVRSFPLSLFKDKDYLLHVLRSADCIKNEMDLPGEVKIHVKGQKLYDFQKWFNKYFSKRKKQSEDANRILYEMRTNEEGHVIVNDVVISRPRWGLENYYIFQHLINGNHDKEFAKDELNKALRSDNISIGKNLDKIAYNLCGNDSKLTRAFFRAGSRNIYLKKHIRKEDLNALKCEYLCYPRKNRKIEYLKPVIMSS